MRSQIEVRDKKIEEFETAVKNLKLQNKKLETVDSSTTLSPKIS